MIKQLFYTSKQGHYQARNELHLSPSGIDGASPHHPWRQVLLLPIETLQTFNLTAGQLKENILLENASDFYDLPSGTVLTIGEAKLRLTFHCEPCSKLKPIITPKKLVHNRGYFAQVIRSGVIKRADSVTVTEKQFDAIPYSAVDRIIWFLTQYPTPILASDLVEEIGLPKSYCRTLPAILKKNPSINPNLILYKKNL